MYFLHRSIVTDLGRSDTFWFDITVSLFCTSYSRRLSILPRIDIHCNSTLFFFFFFSYKLLHTIYDTQKTWQVVNYSNYILLWYVYQLRSYHWVHIIFFRTHKGVIFYLAKKRRVSFHIENRWKYNNRVILIFLYIYKFSSSTSNHSIRSTVHLHEITQPNHHFQGLKQLH